MYDYESMRSTVIDRATQYYVEWQKASDAKNLMLAMEQMHKYKAVAELAQELFDITPEQIQGK